MAQATEKVAKDHRNLLESPRSRSGTVTKKDEIKLKYEVLQGKREDIGAYVKHEVFERSLKKDAINIIDGTWVLKWNCSKTPMEASTASSVAS
eukprot:691067-Amphidinium_carterae.1